MAWDSENDFHRGGDVKKPFVVRVVAAKLSPDYGAVRGRCQIADRGGDDARSRVERGPSPDSWIG